jgi:hypothetical protein
VVCRADALGQQVDEVLDEAHLADALQITQILANHSRQTVPLPDTVLGRGAGVVAGN